MLVCAATFFASIQLMAVDFQKPIPCGETVSYEICQINRVACSPNNVIQFFSNQKGDISLLDIKNFLSKQGLKYKAVKADIVNDLPMPCVCQVKILSNEKLLYHFTVITRIDGDYLWVIDPTFNEKELIKISVTDFNKIYCGYALIKSV